MECYVCTIGNGTHPVKHAEKGHVYLCDVCFEKLKGIVHPCELKRVRCVDVGDYPESLKFGKVYQVIADTKAEEHKMIRVIDDTGEDYLYPSDYFEKL